MTRMSTRAVLAASAALFALPAVPAIAQEAPADETTASNEITVIARRREERLLDVPIAISALSTEALDKAGAKDLSGVQGAIPNVNIVQGRGSASSANFYIRGIGQPDALQTFDPAVGVYVDGVYLSRIQGALLNLFDVQRVEVLRGPQGTLYGKNTTAGAINITTNQPTFDFEGKAEVSVGNLNFVQAKGAISGPITDTLAARFAVSSTSRRGTIYNVTTNQWIQSQDNLGLRGQLLFKPSEAFSITLAGDYSEQDAVCCGSVYVRTGTTQRATNRQFAALAAAQGYTVPSTNPFDRLTDLDSALQAGNKIGGVSLKVKWDVGPGTLTSVTAWRFWDWKPQNDRDFTGLPIVAKSQNPSQQDQYTQELRYNYSGDSLDFVLGAFGFYQRIDTQGTEAHGSASTKWNVNPSSSLYNTQVLDGLTALNTQYLKNTSLAVFGQASWKVTPELTLQPGIRVNYDKKDGFYQRRVFTGAGTEILLDGTTSATKTAQLAIFTPQTISPSFSDWNFSYDFTASYKVARGVLVYATYAKTFKSGGINQNGVPVDASNNPILAAATVKPESVQHYEAGIKTEFWDRRAIFNLSAFRTDIKDYQANVNNGQFGVLRGYLANAGAVRSQGIEADFSVRPSERFNAYVNSAYTDATYRKFVDAPCPPELSGGTSSPANCDISGQRLPGVSKWSFSFGFEANAPVEFLKQDGQVYLGYDGSYRSDFSSNPTPSAYTWIDGYSLSNFRLGFRTDAGLDVYGWVRNAFDQDYFEQLFVGPGNTGLIAGLPGDPRTWGFTVRTNF